MRKNPDQRTVDLRAKYRAKHGDDWWQDEDIKAEYRAERREIYRNGPPSDPMGKGSRPSQKKSTASKRKTKSKPKNVKAQKNARQMDKLVEFLEKELKEPFRFAVTKSSDGSVEEIYVAPAIDGSVDEAISLGIYDDGVRIFMNNHPEENIQGYYSTLKGMKRDIRKFIRQAKEMLEKNEDDIILEVVTSKFQKKLSHFGRHPTGRTKKQLSPTKAKKIAKQALEDLGIEIGRWTSMYGGQGFGAKVKNGTLDGQKVKIVITMHADYWDVAFTEDKTNPKGLLSEVGAVYHFYAQKELGDLVKLMANYYLGAEDGEEIDYDEQEILDDQAIVAALPKKVSKAFFTIVNKLEELPDSYFNDGLYYDHVFITDGVALHIDTKDGSKKTRDLLQVLFLSYNTIQILAVKAGVTKKYKLSSTTAAFNYIKKWIESNSQMGKS